jgi:hypothetical protein
VCGYLGCDACLWQAQCGSRKGRLQGAACMACSKRRTLLLMLDAPCAISFHQLFSD